MLFASINTPPPPSFGFSVVRVAAAEAAEAAEAEAMQGPLLKLRRRYSNLCVSLGGATREERHVTRDYFLAGAPSDAESHADGSDGISGGRGAGGGGSGGDGGGGVGGGSGGSGGSAAIPLLQWQLLDSLGGHTIDLAIDLRGGGGGGRGRGKGGAGKGGAGMGEVKGGCGHMAGQEQGLSQEGTDTGYSQEGTDTGYSQEGTDTSYNAGGGGGDGDEDDDGNGGVVPVLTVGSLTSLLASPALLELFLNSGGVRPCKHGGCEDREAQARSIGA